MRVEEYYYHSPLLEGEPVSHIIKMSKIIFKLLNSTGIGEMYIIIIWYITNNCSSNWLQTVHKKDSILLNFTVIFSNVFQQHVIYTKKNHQINFKNRFF